MRPNKNKFYSTMTRLWFIEFYLKICNICEIVEVKKIVEEVTNYLDGIQHTAKIKNFVLAWNTFTIRQPIKPEQVCLLHWHWLLVSWLTCNHLPHLNSRSYSKAHRLYIELSEDRARLGQLRMCCSAMATRGRISIAPISIIVLIHLSTYQVWCFYHKWEWFYGLTTPLRG